MTDQLPDGIYFSLAFDTYHAQQRLSASGCSNMLTDPATFWADSWLNPDREEPDTEASIDGTAYHVALLEPERFAASYRPEPNPADYPEALMTASEVMATLKELGEKQTVKGESSLDRARRLQALGFDRPIWACVMDDWQRADPDETMIGLPQKVLVQVARDVERIRKNPELLPFVTGGQSEVSVLWTGKDGTRWKARIDYLKPGQVIDLKSFANPSRKNLERCITDAISYNRYYVQAVLYWQAAQAIRDLDLPVIAETAAQEDLVDAIREGTEPFEFWWIFQQKGGVPNALARKLRRNLMVHNDRVADAPDEDRRESLRKKLSRPPSRIFEKGTMELESCARLLRQCQEIWPSGPWGSMVPVGEVDDESFSPYFLES